MFKPVLKYFFSILTGTVDKFWGKKIKGLSEKSIATPATPEQESFASKLTYIQSSEIAVKSKGNCLK